jgi:RNA polymerase sigma-32 factor
MNAKMLSREEEAELIRRWQEGDDESAMQSLVTAHMPLVIKIARKMRGYGLPHDDMVQEGVIGLIRTLKTFKLETGSRFSTLARWYILSAIQEYILQNHTIVKASSSTQNRMGFFKGERFKQVSIDAIIEKHGGDNSFLPSFLIDDGPLPDQLTETMIDGDRMSKRLKKALNNLSDRERDIIRRRYLNAKTETLNSVSGYYGISKERIRQIEVKALKEMKASMIAEGGR